MGAGIGWDEICRYRSMEPMIDKPLITLSSLIDDAKCFDLVRQHRWPNGVRCPTCDSAAVARHGRDETQPDRQRYRCKDCEARFDDLTGTILAGHHRPLRTWVLGLYFMGLNLSNRQIAQELDLSVSDVQAMTEQLRCGLVAKIPPVTLDGEVEVDEVYVVAGHKGNPAAVAKKTALDAAVGSKEPPAGGRWRKKSRQFSA
jgi:transposase-like protein